MAGTLATAHKSLSVLAPTRYPWRFNSPRQSRHHIETRNFVPFNYLSPKLEGVTLFNPFPPRRFDLIHAFNRIPLSRLPFVIGFESHLPRGFGIENSGFYRYMTKRLASDQCRAIVAISEHARRMMLHTHADSPFIDILREKLHMRPPNMAIADREDDEPAAADVPHLVFVGNHFGRKGGCVAVRIAEIARDRNIPLTVDVISSFEVGAMSWTDPLDPHYFDRDRERLALANVNHLQSLPNSEVLARVRKAHFLVLATFSDTFGFSAIEAMANYVPVIATRQGALPEFIEDDVNGIMLDLDTTPFGEWAHIDADRTSPAFATIHREEVDRLAHRALERVLSVLSDRPAYAAMRKAAYDTAKQRFDSQDAAIFWDDLYDRSMKGVVPNPL